MNGDREQKRPGINEIYGTLPDWVIKEYIKRGVIKIEPLVENWEELVKGVTLDFHLGNEILVPIIHPHTYIDVKKGVNEEGYEKITLAEGGPHILKPNQFVISRTKESLVLPDDIVGRLEGRSSLARLGVVVHLTSGRFDPGWVDVPVLELKNNSPADIIIYEGWPICAFSFDRLMASVETPYQGRYKTGGFTSKIHIDNGV